MITSGSRFRIVTSRSERSTPTHGCTARSFLTGRVSAYRFHVDDPIPFDRSFAMEGDYTTVAYWYQAEPHQPLPPLPPPQDRRPRTPWTNPAQWLVVGVAAVAALSAAIMALLR